MADGVTYTNHYGDASSSPAWSSGSDGSWTRYVAGISGLLAAKVTSSGVTLELAELHGNVMATATAGSSSSGPASTYLYNEFGVPEGGAADNYGWLGAARISDDALGGQLLMGVRSYDPSTGRFRRRTPWPAGPQILTIMRPSSP